MVSVERAPGEAVHQLINHVRPHVTENRRASGWYVSLVDILAHRPFPEISRPRLPLFRLALVAEDPSRASKIALTIGLLRNRICSDDFFDSGVA